MSNINIKIHQFKDIQEERDFHLSSIVNRIILLSNGNKIDLFQDILQECAIMYNKKVQNELVYVMTNTMMTIDLSHLSCVIHIQIDRDKNTNWVAWTRYYVVDIQIYDMSTDIPQILDIETMMFDIINQWENKEKQKMFKDRYLEYKRRKENGCKYGK